MTRDIAYSDLNQTKVYEYLPSEFTAGVGYYISDFIGKSADGTTIKCLPEKILFTVESAGTTTTATKRYTQAEINTYIDSLIATDPNATATLIVRIRQKEAEGYVGIRELVAVKLGMTLQQVNDYIATH